MLVVGIALFAPWAVMTPWHAGGGDRGSRTVQAGTVRFDRHGIRAEVPSGWFATDQRMSTAHEPVFRLTVSDRRVSRTARDDGPCFAGIKRQIEPDGVVAILSEARGADFNPSRFRLRSRRFVLPPRKPNEDNSCLGNHATLVIFKDSGRGFYLWLAAAPHAPRARINRLLAVVNPITISANANAGRATAAVEPADEGAVSDARDRAPSRIGASLKRHPARLAVTRRSPRSARRWRSVSDADRRGLSLL